MSTVISDRKKDPLGAMLLDYLHGKQEACCEVESTTLEMSAMAGEVMFRDYTQMDALEHKALAMCTGKVLDVGAGSGCHSLYLQGRGMDVDALDISPGCIKVMEQRQVKHPVHCNIFSLSGRRYSTILMLMNGIGICGSLDGLDLLLQHLKTLLAAGGQVIADSTDLSPLYIGVSAYHLLDTYFGETEFIMKYGDITSNPFPWLYVDYHTLESMAENNGLQCEQVLAVDGGRYLARMF